MKHLSEATGVPVRTLYDWRHTKPELMKIIKLGVATATLIKNREDEKNDQASKMLKALDNR